MSLRRGLSAGLELVVLEKGPKPQSKCAQRGENRYLRCRGDVRTACQVIQSAFPHYLSCSRIQKRFGLKKNDPIPAATMGIITHSNVRISLTQRARKTPQISRTLPKQPEKNKPFLMSVLLERD